MNSEFFDRTYVINLPRRQDRMAAFAERAANAGITSFEKFDGVDGSLAKPPHWWRVGSGAWGCLMSHARVLEDALSKGYQSILVFEDDVVFCDRFNRRSPTPSRQSSGSCAARKPRSMKNRRPATSRGTG